jgi:uncharacterized protein
MYRFIPKDQFITSAWKNGGGVTHEIAKDAPDWGWRFSLAEVASDGPFSRFDGMARILTVILGAGLDLHHAAGVIAARPLQPVAFSGDTAIDCRRVAGLVHDFNVIYDPKRFVAKVQIMQGLVDFGTSVLGILHMDGGRIDGFHLGTGPFMLDAPALGVIIDPR